MDRIPLTLGAFALGFAACGLLLTRALCGHNLWELLR